MSETNSIGALDARTSTSEHGESAVAAPDSMTVSNVGEAEQTGNGEVNVTGRGPVAEVVTESEPLGAIHAAQAADANTAPPSAQGEADSALKEKIVGSVEQAPRHLLSEKSSESPRPSKPKKTVRIQDPEPDPETDSKLQLHSPRLSNGKISASSNVFATTFGAVLVLVLAVLGRLGWLKYNHTLYLLSHEPSLAASWMPPQQRCQVHFEDKLKYCEDAMTWRGSALVSCDPGRAEWNTVMGPLKNPMPRGSLHAVDLVHFGKPEVFPIELVNFPAHFDFHPLGIEIFENTLFVVNHQRRRSTIDVFELTTDAVSKAIWKRSISHPLIRDPNAVAALSATKILVTNAFRYSRKTAFLRHLIELYLVLPLSWVVEIDLSTKNTTVTKVAAGIPFANGIAISTTKNQVAVASSNGGRVYLYEKDLLSSRLTLQETIPVPFHPDNVKFDAAPFESQKRNYDASGYIEGGLYIAGSASFRRLSQLASDPVGKGFSSPTWALEARRRTKKGGRPSRQTVLDPSGHVTPAEHVGESRLNAGWELRTLYQSNGTGFSSGTTAAVDSATKLMVIPGLYARGLLVCTNVPSR